MSVPGAPSARASHHGLRQANTVAVGQIQAGTLRREVRQRGRAILMPLAALVTKLPCYWAKYCPAPLQHGRDDTGGVD